MLIYVVHNQESFKMLLHNYAKIVNKFRISTSLERVQFLLFSASDCILKSNTGTEWNKKKRVKNKHAMPIKALIPFF